MYWFETLLSTLVIQNNLNIVNCRFCSVYWWAPMLWKMWIRTMHHMLFSLKPLLWWVICCIYLLKENCSWILFELSLFSMGSFSLSNGSILKLSSGKIEDRFICIIQSTMNFYDHCSWCINSVASVKGSFSLSCGSLRIYLLLFMVWLPFHRSCILMLKRRWCLSVLLCLENLLLFGSQIFDIWVWWVFAGLKYSDNI